MEYEYARPTDVECPAVGNLYAARDLKKRAWKRLKFLREALKREPLGGGSSRIRMDIIYAQDSHNEAQRMERGALEVIEKRANELGKTTVKASKKQLTGA